MNTETNKPSPNRKTVTGTVVSNKMQKTIVVESKTKIKHDLYEKYITHRSKLMAHDEEQKCKEGDKVVLRECRPLSKRKRWEVIEILNK